MIRVMIMLGNGLLFLITLRIIQVSLGARGSAAPKV